MLNANQIANILREELAGDSTTNVFERIEAAAEKIAALCGDDGAAVAAASIERDVSSALIDLVVATVLATLIEEEGGGRSNIAISPLSMDHTTKHYEIESSMDGMIRKVEIKLRDDSDLRDEEKWRDPSNRHGLMHQDEPTEGALPQAEPKTHDRPVWAVRCWGTLQNAGSRERAEEMVRTSKAGFMEAKVENRWCLHLDCPTTGCNHDPALRDHSEATSELTDTE